MINLKSLSTVLVSIALLTGCKNTNHKTELNGFPVQGIDFYSYDLSYDTDIAKSYFTDTKLIPLSSENTDYIFSTANQCIIRNNLIYILDWRARTLFIFDMEGNPVKKLARQGRGPEEYLQISKFEIDRNGDIIVWDGQSDHLFFYSSELQLIKKIKAKFDIEDIKLLDENHFIISLTSWNSLEHAGTKILITDRELNVLEHYLSYDEFVDNNMFLNTPQLVSLGSNHFAYVGLIDNNIYQFTDKNYTYNVLSFDFGGRNVPNEIRANVEENFFNGNLKNYTSIDAIYAITDKYIYGSLRDGLKKRLFLIDLSTKKCLIGKEDSNLPIGTSEGTIISLIDNDGEYVIALDRIK